jgi:putative methionine-R-sulfoxide reductase with GAF domain
MIEIKNIYNKLLSDLQPSFDNVVTRVKGGRDAVRKSGSRVGQVFKNIYDKVFGFINATSRIKKAYITMGVYIVIFYLWQLKAYECSQTLFVLVNLVMVTIAALFLSYILVQSKKAITKVNDDMKELMALKKKRDHEISAMKSELMSLRMERKKQISFGKKSQALIDAIQVYKKEQKPGVPKGQFVLKSLAQCYEICGAVIYLKEENEDVFRFAGEYALADRVASEVVDSNDGLIGQVMKTKKVMEVNDVPAEYFTVITGLGHTSTIHLYVLPIVKNDEVCGVIEATSFNKLAVVDVWEDIQGLLLA